MALSNTPYATNPVGATTKALEADATHAPTIQTYHGGSIVVGGNIIGRITEWQPAGYTRAGSHVYELNQNSWGVPVDYVPGIASDFNISLTRNEVWSEELEITLGFNAVFENLTDQTRPYTAKEFIYRGSTPYRQWDHYGCWLTSKNRSAWSSEGNGIISVSGAMAYVSRKRTL